MNEGKKREAQDRTYVLSNSFHSGGSKTRSQLMSSVDDRVMTFEKDAESHSMPNATLCEVPDIEIPKLSHSTDTNSHSRILHVILYHPQRCHAAFRCCGFPRLVAAFSPHLKLPSRNMLVAIGSNSEFRSTLQEYLKILDSLT